MPPRKKPQKIEPTVTPNADDDAILGDDLNAHPVEDNTETPEEAAPAEENDDGQAEPEAETEQEEAPVTIPEIAAPPVHYYGRIVHPQLVPDVFKDGHVINLHRVNAHLNQSAEDIPGIQRHKK